MILREFVNWYNNEFPNHLYVPNSVAIENILRESLSNNLDPTQGLDYSDQNNRKLRISQLGKPAIFQALHKIGIPSQLEAKTIRIHTVLLFGDVFEAYVISLMEAFGVPIKDQQKEVTWSGVLGHIDCVADDMLLDVKTMSSHYYRTFTKYPDDERGYITQLVIYAKALGYEKAGWLCFNKETAELKLVTFDLNSEYAKNKIDRARAIIDAIILTETVDEVLDRFDIPKPKEELRYKKPTGRYYLQPSLKYNLAITSCFYNLETAGTKIYATERKTKDETRALLLEL